MATAKQNREYYLRQQQKRRKLENGVIPKPNGVLYQSAAVTYQGKAVTYGD